jgi:UDP-N-acetylmuramate: L-alanyl-gamma-D-glutamyl-meso-diaminopimelate ligase
MGGIALLARQMGYEVSGSDANVYPPMSTMLQEQGINIKEGYDPAHLDPAPDWVVIGNAMSRGNPAVEYVLNRNLPYISGPQFLADYVIRDRWVLAVAGTHGKTTTSSLLAWILEYAKLSPGFLVGGVPANFGLSARLGDAPFFVVEADEYDTAFFDKRSKFIHYRPRTLILNNLEYDHADIFENLEAIKKQFHHLVRTVPGNGLIIAPSEDANLSEVIGRGCWTPLEYFDSSGGEKQGWSAQLINPDGSAFKVYWKGKHVGDVKWNMLGMHNVNNALAAIAAARHAGVIADQAVAALNEFKGIKRRMEMRGEVAGVKVYDDFAHHPTAISTTLQGIRRSVGDARVLVAFEARSNTMKMGVHRASLAASFADADRVMFLQPQELSWSLNEVSGAMNGRGEVYATVEEIVQELASEAKQGDHIVIMSNGGFGGIHHKLIAALEQR